MQNFHIFLIVVAYMVAMFFAGISFAQVINPTLVIGG